MLILTYLAGVLLLLWRGEFSAVLTKTAISRCHSLLVRILISPESQAHCSLGNGARASGNLSPVSRQSSSGVTDGSPLPPPRAQHEDRPPSLGEQTDAESFSWEDSSDFFSCWSSALVPPRPCPLAASQE